MVHHGQKQKKHDNQDKKVFGKIFSKPGVLTPQVPLGKEEPTKPEAGLDVGE